MQYFDYLLRLPFSATFFYHGLTKVFPADPDMNVQIANAMLGSTALWTGLGVVEMLIAIAILAGGFTNALVTRLAGLGGAVVMIGAIAKVHWANGFDFTNPGVGFELHLLYLGTGLYFVLRGNGAGFTPMAELQRNS